MSCSAKLFTNGKVVRTHRVERADVLVEDGKIVRVAPEIREENAERIDLGGKYLTPGFIDVHVHGGGDCLFSDATEEAYRKILTTHLAHGTTGILCTLSAVSLNTIFASLDVFNKMKEAPRDYTLPELCGIHMEGPYFSAEQRGAQSAAQIRTPKPEEYMQIFERSPYIRKWASACELPGSKEFARELVKRGIIASIGHSAASLEQVREAIGWGFSCITHFYSGCSSLHRVGPWREAGVVEAGYLFDDLRVEMISDGCHLPEPFLKLIYKVKGPDSISAITDAIRAAGVPNAEEYYAEGSQKDSSQFVVRDGVAILPDNTAFAGSIATTDRLVRTLVNVADIPMYDAVRMTSMTPAKELGIDALKGSIDEGKDADLVVMSEDLYAEDVYVCGHRVAK